MLLLLEYMILNKERRFLGHTVDMLYLIGDDKY